MIGYKYTFSRILQQQKSLVYLGNAAVDTCGRPGRRGHSDLVCISWTHPSVFMDACAYERLHRWTRVHRDPYLLWDTQSSALIDERTRTYIHGASDLHICVEARLPPRWTRVRRCASCPARSSRTAAVASYLAAVHAPCFASCRMLAEYAAFYPVVPLTDFVAWQQWSMSQASTVPYGSLLASWHRAHSLHRGGVACFALRSSPV